MGFQEEPLGPTHAGLAPREQEPGQGVRVWGWVGGDCTVPVISCAPALLTCTHVHAASPERAAWPGLWLLSL